MATKEAHRRANRNYYKKHKETLVEKRKKTRNVSNPQFKATEDVYRQKNRERVQKHALQNRVRQFGITIVELEEMRTRQNNRCAICGNPPQKRDLHIDHDHATNKVRELLCHFCNSGLGQFRDNVDVMYKAIEYLEKHSWTDTKAIKV